MKRAVLFALINFVGLVCTPLRADEKKPEPRYEGKPAEYWVKQLRTCETNEQRNAASNALIAFGADATPAVPELVEMLDDRSQNFREYVCQVLGAIGPDAKPVVPALVRLLKEKKARDPKQVIECLGSIGPPAAEAVPELIAALKDRELTRSAILALGAVGPAAKDAVPALVDLVGDEQLGSKAARALGWIGPAARTAIPAIRRAVRDWQTRREDKQDETFPGNVVWALGKLGPDSVPLLVELLEKAGCAPDECANTLGEFGPAAKPAVPALLKALKSDRFLVRIAAARALWRIEKHPDALPALTELLDDKAPFGNSAVECAADALSELGSAAKPALPALKKAFDNCPPPGSVMTVDDWGRVRAVAKAIKKIDPEEAKKLKVEP